nr:hypothetical protein [Tanacetum cinerariifolium]
MLLHRSFPLTDAMVVRSDSALAADIVATSTLLGVSRTPALVKPPQKKCAFQMSAPEDDSFEIDDALAADIVVTSTLPGVSRTSGSVEVATMSVAKASSILNESSQVHSSEMRTSSEEMRSLEAASSDSHGPAVEVSCIHVLFYLLALRAMHEDITYSYCDHGRGNTGALPFLPRNILGFFISLFRHKCCRKGLFVPDCQNASLSELSSYGCDGGLVGVTRRRYGHGHGYERYE